VEHALRAKREHGESRIDQSRKGIGRKDGSISEGITSKKRNRVYSIEAHSRRRKDGGKERIRNPIIRSIEKKKTGGNCYSIWSRGRLPSGTKRTFQGKDGGMGR